MLGFGVLVISGMLASGVVLGVWFSLYVPVADFGMIRSVFGLRSGVLVLLVWLDAVFPEVFSSMWIDII